MKKIMNVLLNNVAPVLLAIVAIFVIPSFRKEIPVAPEVRVEPFDHGYSDECLEELRNSDRGTDFMWED